MNLIKYKNILNIITFVPFLLEKEQRIPLTVGEKTYGTESNQKYKV